MNLDDTNADDPWFTAEERAAPIRKILHVDMDAFYASVELRDRPELAHLPVVVGAEGRGVVLTASYTARKFGVRSAMPGFKARQLCPELIFVRPRFPAYIEASEKTRAIFRRYAELVEPRSLDEAFLDVTNNPQGLYATQVAKAIAATVVVEVGITCSIGVASNKLLAKIASDFRKPSGITVVTPEKVLDFLGPQELRVIPGVGPVTAKRLAERGLLVCSDVWPLSRDALIAMFDERFARWIWRKSRGLDRGLVAEDRGERKSMGCQHSIGPGLHDRSVLNAELDRIGVVLAERMQKRSLLARSVTLNLKHEWKRMVSRTRTLTEATADANVLSATARELLDQYERRTDPIRLVGISVSGFSTSNLP